MPEAVRFSLIAISTILVLVGGYHRVQSQRSGEHLDRKKEGWLLLISIRLLGLLTLASAVFWFCSPIHLTWAAEPIPVQLRWFGVFFFACVVAWLIWTFRALGSNLTDTVVTRRNAYFVDQGPYRFVRNPMYTGVIGAGISLGFALGTWLFPIAACFMFLLFAIRTRTEEKYLIKRFGDPYRDYMKRVGRFFPKLPIHD